MKKIKLLTLLLSICTMMFLTESCKKAEEILDPCASVTCQNGGECIDGTCDCPLGFTGTNCETEDLCVTGNIDCQNGGTCVDGTCDCPLGFTGVNCETVLKVRKNAKDLTAEEKQNFVNAILTLKATPSPYTDTLSYYDTFVKFNQMAIEKTECTGTGNAYGNPAFLAWHRKLLIMYEEALSDVSGKDIALPYWDWTDQASTDATFATNMMGGNGDPNDEYALNDGSFRKDNWQVNLFSVIPRYYYQSQKYWLVRNFGATTTNYPGYPVSLPTSAQVNNCQSITEYDASPYDCSGMLPANSSFRFCIEGFLDGTCSGAQAMSNIVHDYVGGSFEIPGTGDMVTAGTYNAYCNVDNTDMVPNNVRVGSMTPIDVAANDPVFFMHYANVDRLWAEWQSQAGNADKYEPVSGATTGYNKEDSMFPYNIPAWQTIPQMIATGNTPGSMLDYEALGYTY